MFERMDRIEEIKFNDIKQFAQKYIKEQLISSFVIHPKKEQ